MVEESLATVPLIADFRMLWLLHDCLAPALAGFSGRSESAEPWHAINLLRKVRYELTRYDQSGHIEAPRKGFEGTTTSILDCTMGELECIDYNVPPTASAEARTLLLRVFQALAQFDLHSTVMPTNIGEEDWRCKLSEWPYTSGDGTLLPSD